MTDSRTLCLPIPTQIGLVHVRGSGLCLLLIVTVSWYVLYFNQCAQKSEFTVLYSMTACADSDCLHKFPNLHIKTPT